VYTSNVAWNPIFDSTNLRKTFVHVQHKFDKQTAWCDPLIYFEYYFSCSHLILQIQLDLQYICKTEICNMQVFPRGTLLYFGAILSIPCCHIFIHLAQTMSFSHYFAYNLLLGFGTRIYFCSIATVCHCLQERFVVSFYQMRDILLLHFQNDFSPSTALIWCFFLVSSCIWMQELDRLV
jgi:hypothetical protein